MTIRLPVLQIPTIFALTFQLLHLLYLTTAMNVEIIENADSSQATIFDVAKLCGVSRGTVDRVIHNRGRVSKETVDKVRRAIKILGYKPNPNASLLASKKTLTFACLIPQFKPGEYWEKIYQGFVSGARTMYNYNIDVKFQLYDQTNPQSFIECCNNIVELKPTGVIMNAVFHSETLQFAQQLEDHNIPYAFVDNKFDDLDYTLYYGVDPYKSGTLGAFLLTNHSNPTDIALICLIRDRDHKADPNGPRRQGFLDYITQHFPACTVHTIFIDPADQHQTYLALQDFFKQHPEVKHIAMTNSRIYLIDEYLRNNPDQERTVVGFDDLEANLSTLRSGQVEYLVTRHIPRQSEYVLKALTEAVIQGVKPTKRNNYLHMDILHRLNLDDY